jgi:hypothetical protein
MCSGGYRADALPVSRISIVCAPAVTRGGHPGVGVSPPNTTSQVPLSRSHQKLDGGTQPNDEGRSPENRDRGDAIDEDRQDGAKSTPMSQRDRQRQTQDGEEHDTHREERHEQLIRQEPLVKGDTNDATGPGSPNGIQKRIRGVPGRLPGCSVCLPSVLGGRARAKSGTRSDVNHPRPVEDSGAQSCVKKNHDVRSRHGRQESRPLSTLPAASKLDGTVRQFFFEAERR